MLKTARLFEDLTKAELSRGQLPPAHPDVEDDIEEHD